MFTNNHLFQQLKSHIGYFTIIEFEIGKSHTSRSGYLLSVGRKAHLQGISYKFHIPISSIKKVYFRE